MQTCDFCRLAGRTTQALDVDHIRTRVGNNHLCFRCAYVYVRQELEEIANKRIDVNMPKQEELELVFRREKQRIESWVIAECEKVGTGELFGGDLVTVKTTCEPHELVSDRTYSFLGRWEYTHNWGQQFAASSFMEAAPRGERGVLSVLIEAPGIGDTIAARLWAQHHGQAIEQLRDDPAVGIAAGMPESHARQAHEFLGRRQAISDSELALRDLFAGRRIPRTVIKEAMEAWGARAAALVKRDAFALMQFTGVGFKTADNIYLELGGDPQRLKRQTLCVVEGMREHPDGHTWFAPKQVADMLRREAGIEIADPKKAVRLGVRARRLTTRRDDADRLWIAVAAHAADEARIANTIKASRELVPRWPIASDSTLSDDQMTQLGAATAARIGFLGGSPGTGKTFAAAALLRAIVDDYGAGRVSVACPTGKAAQRIIQVMRDVGLPLQATTIHSLLEAAPTSGGGFGFRRDENYPLDADFLVIDEASMCGAPLMSRLLRACKPTTHVLFVGDPGQLLPVKQHGAPIRDFLHSDEAAACGVLSETQRNAGLIVESCAEIRDGHSPMIPQRFNLGHGRNVKLVAAKDERDTIRKIVETLRTIRDRDVLDTVADVQVIVGTNDMRHQLNRELQREFNSKGKSAKGNPFRVSDKIICLKNGTMPREDRRGEAFVANGEQGIVTDVFENRTVAQFVDPLRVLVIPRSTEEYGKSGCNFDLGYAITCHKSQGSEWPLTIIGLPSRRGEIGSREWLYTALSRAKKACILVGRQPVIESMVRRPRIGERQTGLVELLKSPATPPVVKSARPRQQTQSAGDDSPCVELPLLTRFLAAGKSARVCVGEFSIERHGRGFKVGRHTVIEPGGQLRTTLPIDHEIIRQLQAIDESPEDRLAEIGRDSGQCVFCGRELSDPLSVLHGYGPTCAQRNGLPWGVELEITR